MKWKRLILCPVKFFRQLHLSVLAKQQLTVVELRSHLKLFTFVAIVWLWVGNERKMQLRREKNPLEKKGRLLLQWVHIMSLLWQLRAALCPWEIHSLSSKTVTSPKIAVNKGRAWRDFVPQLEHLPYMNCCFIVCQHMADLNPFFS